MLIRGATPDDIRAAAAEVGVSLRGGSSQAHSRGGEIRARGKGFRVQLCTAGERTPSGRVKPGTARYRRLSSRDGRTVPGAVCWHGHRDFMRALFARCPEAVIISALATYRGADDFERTHRASAEGDTGPAGECACIGWPEWAGHCGDYYTAAPTLGEARMLHQRQGGAR